MRQRQTIDAFEDALSILTKDRAKRNWVDIIEATSRVYMELGRMTQDIDAMWQSTSTLDSALAQVKRDEDPEEWAALTLRLGATLSNIGEETKTLEPNQRPIRVLKAALTSIDREADPESWSDAKNCLGMALQFVGDECNDPQTIRNAIAAYTDALTVRTRDEFPTYWADTMNNMLGKFLGNENNDLENAPDHHDVTEISTQLTDIYFNDNEIFCGYTDFGKYVLFMLGIAKDNADTVLRDPRYRCDSLRSRLRGLLL